VAFKNDENWTAKLTIAGRKIAATAFIVLILNANFWLIKRFTGEDIPQWASWIFVLGVAGAFGGFILMLPGLLNPPKVLDSAIDDLENTKHRD
jgi:hypothetical protein